jgi:hypothetical protein
MIDGVYDEGMSPLKDPRPKHPMKTRSLRAFPTAQDLGNLAADSDCAKIFSSSHHQYHYN